MKYRSAPVFLCPFVALATGLQAASTIYITSNFGPYKSTDGGASFTQLTVHVTNPFVGPGVHSAGSIAVDPKNPNIVYFIGDACYKSVDGGQTWSAATALGFTFLSGVGRLAIDPVTTNVLYARGIDGSNNNIVVKSTDSGVTWHPTTTIPPPTGVPVVNANTLTLDPSHSGVLYVSGTNYLFKTTDFGTTWTELTSFKAREITQVYVDPKHSQVLYGTTGFSFSSFDNCNAAGNGGGHCALFKSIDGGKNWIGVNIPGIVYATSVAFDAVTDDVYAAAEVNGLGVTLLKSIDSGVTWTPLSNKLNGNEGLVVHTDPSASIVHVLPINSDSNHFYTSPNGGTSFSVVQVPPGCNDPHTGPTCVGVVFLYDFAIGAPTAPPPPPPPPVTGPTRTISHIANGAGWRTTGILINTGTTAESFELKFWDNNGSPMVLNLGADGMTADLIDVIEPGAARFIQTAGTGANLQEGWAELTAPLDIDGNSIFGLQSPGHGDSEAAVPLNPSGGVELFVPFDYTTGFSTGIAFADPGQHDANLTGIILDDTGAHLPSGGTVTIPARGHKSFVVATPFPGVIGKRGVVHFSSNTNIFGLGIRANGKAFTSIDALAGVTSATKTIPHIANGGGWKTTFLIVCTASTASNFTLKFWHDNGAALVLPLGANGTVSSITGTLQPGEIRIVETTNAGPLITGWAELSGLTGAIGGTAIFASQSPGQSDSEAAVPFSTAASTHLFMPYDYSPGYSTAIAFANTSQSQATVTATFTDDAGHVLGSAPPIIIPPHGHTAAVLGGLLAGIPGTRGTVSLTSNVPVFGLGIRANGSAFTSLKVINK